ncbi:MAG: DNA repair protein RecO [Bacteroidales bacterium]|nr:DNA repair protein RecO [Bacteroidales bacterium]
MLATSPAFVLKTTNYSETSVIAKVYTREWGLQSVMIKGVHSPKSRNKQNLLQPLSYVDISMYRNEKKQIQFAKEVRPYKQWKNTPFDYEKTAITFFINELLYKTIREEASDVRMFNFIDECLSTLDEHKKSLADFPIRFLIKASAMFGFSPMNNFSARENLFNLNEGRFVSPPDPSLPPMDMILADGPSELLHNYLTMTDIYNDEMSPNASQRNELLSALLEYFKIHFNQLGDFKSHLILHEVLR